MTVQRLLTIVVAIFVAGLATPFAAPASWLAYLFWIAGLCALVFGALSAASGQEDGQSRSKSAATRTALWLTIGTDRPGARLTDRSALMCFFATLSFLAGLTVGAFAAVIS